MIIKGYEEYGEGILKKLIGMFAFALWDNRDRKKRRLFLAKDRLGKKPLFYYYDDERFVFASELKSIIEDETIKRDICLESISSYLSYGYIPAPKSIFKGIYKIMPGYSLICEDGKIKTSQYWDLNYDEMNFSEDYYAKTLLANFEEAVRIRLTSDVPLGAFLSGGIDSSAVVAMMSRFSNKPVKTFTIGFEEQEFNEIPYARIIAERFGTEHHEKIVRPDVISILPKLVWHYDEPYSDSSALPSYYVAKMAKEHATVVLTGDGGDENFAGYERYSRDKIFSKYEAIPDFIRKTVSYSIGLLPLPREHYGLYRKLKRFDELSKMSREDRFINSLIICDDKMKNDLVNQRFSGLDLNSSELIRCELRKNNSHDFLNKMMYSDIKKYLPYDLLVKMDIATMANSLEARSPFLDHKLMEFAASIPSSLKLKGFTKKYILKKSLNKLLPKQILNREKKGFGVPLNAWFMNDLQNLAYNTLLDKETFISEYIRPNGVKNVLDMHSAKRKNNAAIIWSLLWLEIWGRIYIQDRKLKNVY